MSGSPKGFSLILNSTYVFHDSMKPKNSDFNSYICILYYQSNISYYFTIKIRMLSSYLEFNIAKRQSLNSMEVDFPRLTSCRYVTDVTQTYVIKERYRLT